MKSYLLKHPGQPTAAGRSPKQTSAFTFTELLCVAGALALLAGVVLPVLGQSKPRSEQAVCFNNLRGVGQALLQFNAENDQLDPWRAPGFGYDHPGKNNSFIQAYFLSNNLVSAKVLACPSDASARPATDFSLSPQGGFLNAAYRNYAVSYFWGLDSTALNPDSVLSGDRNIRYDGFGACSSGINPAATIFLSSPAPTSWRPGLHGPSGNILLHDGRVEQTSDTTVNRLFKSNADDNGSIHLQLPRP